MSVCTYVSLYVQVCACECLNVRVSVYSECVSPPPCPAGAAGVELRHGCSPSQADVEQPRPTLPPNPIEKIIKR